MQISLQLFYSGSHMHTQIVTNRVEYVYNFCCCYFDNLSPNEEIQLKCVICIKAESICKESKTKNG